MKDSQKDILTQHLILKEDPQEDILTQKYVEDDPFECATQALDVGSLKLPTRVTRIKSEFEKKTKR